jgi:lysophospholipase L1-like esterase
MHIMHQYAILALLGLLVAPARVQLPDTPDPARWESEIRAFEAADAVDPPPRNGIVFTGSSSIRLWTALTDDFAPLPVINRGFGGSVLAEVTALLDRTTLPHRPQLVVVYCGGNDINDGHSADQVLHDFQRLVEVLHTALPTTRIAYLSIAPNPARWSQVETVKAANRAIQEFVSTDSRLAFIDVFPRMLGPDGQPRPDIFLDDGLHMNRKGYEIWIEVIRPYLKLVANE